jgi:hypothetical protein
MNARQQETKQVEARGCPGCNCACQEAEWGVEEATPAALYSHPAFDRTVIDQTNPQSA